MRYTKLDRWIMRGENQKYVVKRLIHADSILTNTKVEDMKRLGKEFKGKDYDLTFEWSDDKIYCSELIWKIYKRGLDIELTQLETLNDFDLSNAEVKTKLRERYGDQIPLNEPVISPKSLFESPLLKTIKEK